MKVSCKCSQVPEVVLVHIIVDPLLYFITECGGIAGIKGKEKFDIDFYDPETRKTIMKTDVVNTITDPDKQSITLAVAAGMAMADGEVDLDEMSYLQALMKAWDQKLDTHLMEKIQSMLVKE